MKPTQANPNKVKSSGIQNSVKFGIKASGLAHIFNVLRNQLYSDKILAVVREYSTNAVDAHIEAGKPDLPIEVTMPNRLNPFLKVRDFGPALTDEEIADIYAFYGESTKRNTNEQTGMLGIGSKSAFAYGDNFVINSYVNGKKHVYNAFIDVSQVGQISKLHAEDTKEPDGIEIVIPVKDDDVGEFAQKAQALFKWFKVKPTIKGVAEFDYEDSNVLFSGNDWEWLQTNKDRWSRTNEAIAVMGNIGYPIDSSDVQWNGDDEKDGITGLLIDNLVLRFDIGDLEISASREKLQFTDFTRENIKKRLRAVAKELRKTVLAEFESCDTFFDAKCLHGEVFDYSSGLYELRSVLNGKMIWNGNKVKDDAFADLPDVAEGLGEPIKLYELAKPASRRGFRLSLQPRWKIQCKKDVVVVENDSPNGNRGALSKLLPLAIDQKKKVYILDFRDAKSRKAWMKATGFDAKMPLLSDLPKKKISDYYATSSTTTNSKGERVVAKTFTLKTDASFGRWHSKKSDYWKAAEVDFDNDKGLFVILDRFCAKTSNDDWGDLDPSSLIRLVGNFEEVTGFKLPTIYGIKVAQADKVTDKDNWTPLENYISDKVNDLLEKENLCQDLVNARHADEIRREEKFFFKQGKEVYDQLEVQDGEFAVFYQRYNLLCPSDTKKSRMNAIVELAKECRLEVKVNDVEPAYNLDEHSLSLMMKYPMLQVMENHCWGDNYNKRARVIIDYINLIDITNHKSVF